MPFRRAKPCKIVFCSGKNQRDKKICGKDTILDKHAEKLRRL